MKGIHYERFGGLNIHHMDVFILWKFINMIFKICALNCICLENSKLKKLNIWRKWKGERREREKKVGWGRERDTQNKILASLLSSVLPITGLKCCYDFLCLCQCRWKLSNPSIGLNPFILLQNTKNEKL